MVRRNVQPDTALDWSAVAELAGTGTMTASMRPTPANRPLVQPDPLSDLLATPLHKLTAPLPVDSAILGERIYFVATDHQAATIREQGGVAYTPAEVEILWELHQAVAPEVWAKRLKLIHEAKRRFEGAIIRPEEP